MGHALMENRSGLLVGACLTRADGHAERVAALALIEPYPDRPRAITLGADKGYDAADFVNELRAMRVTPHVAQNTSGRRSAIDGRTTRHAGYGLSQRIRKRVEEAFGWIKPVLRRRAGGVRLHLCCGGLQPGLPAPASGARIVSAVAECEVVGRWRIVGSDVWDRAYLDLVDPAFISIGRGGRRELAFEVVNASIDLAYSRTKATR